jgi:hypothetical protein
MCRLTLLALCLLLAAPARAETPVDLELILAVDASGSVDAQEYDLQMRGIAVALTDPEVAAAVTDGLHGAVAVTVMLWAEGNRPKQSLAWRRLADAADLAAFAAEVAAMPRRLPAGGTGIGKALQYAAWEIERNGFAGVRRVIDLSGDGRQSAAREHTLSARQGRAFAVLRGITINALAIRTDVADLDAYYRAEVIGGPGAFVEIAAGYADFAAAMRRKLIREIRWRPQVSGLEARQGAPAPPARGSVP